MTWKRRCQPSSVVTVHIAIAVASHRHVCFGRRKHQHRPRWRVRARNPSSIPDESNHFSTSGNEIPSSLNAPSPGLQTGHAPSIRGLYLVRAALTRRPHSWIAEPGKYSRVYTGDTMRKWLRHSWRSGTSRCFDSSTKRPRVGSGVPWKPTRCVGSR